MTNETNFLDLSDDQVKNMLENLISEGFCKYSFKIGNIDVSIKSLTWEENELLVKKIASIPRETIDAGQEKKRDVTVNEFNTVATAYTLDTHLVSFNNDTSVDINKLSKNVVSIIAQKIAKLENTINEKLLSVAEIKN